MKRRTLLILAMAFILWSFNSLAQETRYVEVVCSESFVLKPASFMYQVSFGKQTELVGRSQTGNHDEDTPQSSLASIEKLIQSGNFDYSVEEAQDFSIPAKTKQPTLEVQVKSLNELEKLHDLLKGQKGIKGRIKDVQYQSTADSEEGLFDQLFKDALQQARQMASVSDNSVGRLMNVTEIVEERDSEMEMAEKMMKKVPMMGMMYDSQNVLEEETTRRFRFRFELT